MLCGRGAVRCLWFRVFEAMIICVFCARDFGVGVCGLRCGSVGVASGQGGGAGVVVGRVLLAVVVIFASAGVSL